MRKKMNVCKYFVFKLNRLWCLVDHLQQEMYQAYLSKQIFPHKNKELSDQVRHLFTENKVIMRSTATCMSNSSTDHVNDILNANWQWESKEFFLRCLPQLGAAKYFNLYFTAENDVIIHLSNGLVYLITNMKITRDLT